MAYELPKEEARFVNKPTDILMKNDKKQIIIEIMKIIMNYEGDLIRMNHLNNSALSLGYDINDEIYYKLLIQHCNTQNFISSQVWRTLLTKMVKDKRNQFLKITFQACRINAQDEEFLLNLAKTALKENSKDAYEIILNHCNNRNMILSNGETFLTDLINIEDDDGIIEEVVRSGYFDLNVVNAKEESALMLACSKLKQNVVKSLLQCGSDVKYKNFAAVQTTFATKTENDSQELEEISNKIVNMLWNMKAEKNVSVPVEKLPLPKRVKTNPEQKVLDIMQLLLINRGDLIKDNDKKQNVLSLAYDLSDKSFFQALLETANPALEIFSSAASIAFLKMLADQKNWVVLSAILDKSIVHKKYNNNLLYMALIVLARGEREIYQKLMNKCTDFDAKFRNGETFLTSLFKAKLPENLIRNVIKSEAFNIRKANDLEETPLMLACDQLLPAVVEDLLKQDCDISYGGYIAVVIAAKSDINTEDSKKNQIKILSLLCSQGQKELPITNAIVRSRVKSLVSQTVQNLYPHRIIETKSGWIENLSKTNLVESLIVALFAKSDNADFLISPYFYETSCVEDGKDIKSIMAWKIVFALREHGFVSHHRIMELAHNFEGIDILSLEDVSVFLSKLSPKEQFLSLSTYNQEERKNTSIKLFIELKNSLDYITSQELINVSMIQNKIMFNKIPDFLIVEAIRDSKSVFSYRNIIPSRTIDISKINMNSFKKCFLCDLDASWQCQDCITEQGLDIVKGLFCKHHKCSHIGICILPKSPFQSRSKVFMNLYSIICKTNTHYYAIVKQKGIEKKWYLFEVVDQDGMMVSKVSEDDEVSHFLNSSDERMRNIIMASLSPNVFRILKESYIFIYENDSLLCY